MFTELTTFETLTGNQDALSAWSSALFLNLCDYLNVSPGMQPATWQRPGNMASLSERRPPALHILIERAAVQDAEAIKQMVVSAYSKYVERIGREPAPMTADYHAIIVSQSQDVYVLRQREDGRVVGSILLSDSDKDDSVKVNNLVVDPAAQGRGYGRLLMNFAEDIARTCGRAALTLFTNEKMSENLALYVKMGFGEIERRVEDGYRRVYFRKPLVPVVPS